LRGPEVNFDCGLICPVIKPSCAGTSTLVGVGASSVITLAPPAAVCVTLFALPLPVAADFVAALAVVVFFIFNLHAGFTPETFLE
jgi:hypothetical protein